MLARNVPQTPKQGEREGQEIFKEVYSGEKIHCLFAGEFPSDTEPLIEISFARQFHILLY